MTTLTVGEVEKIAREAGAVLGVEPWLDDIGMCGSDYYWVLELDKCTVMIRDNGMYDLTLFNIGRPDEPDIDFEIVNNGGADIAQQVLWRVLQHTS